MEMAGSGLPRRQVLEWHLAHNCYPPISADFIETAEVALDCVKDDKPERVITMPNGIRKQAQEIVESMYLEDFLQLDG